MGFFDRASSASSSFFSFSHSPENALADKRGNTTITRNTNTNRPTHKDESGVKLARAIAPFN